MNIYRKMYLIENRLSEKEAKKENFSTAESEVAVHKINLLSDAIDKYFIKRQLLLKKAIKEKLLYEHKVYVCKLDDTNSRYFDMCSRISSILARVAKLIVTKE